MCVIAETGSSDCSFTKCCGWILQSQEWIFCQGEDLRLLCYRQISSLCQSSRSVCSQNITFANYQKEFFFFSLSDNRRWNASAAVSEEARGRERWAARGILSSWDYDRPAVCGTAQTCRTTLQRLQSARQEVCLLFIVSLFVPSLFGFNERKYLEQYLIHIQKLNNILWAWSSDLTRTLTVDCK